MVWSGRSIQSETPIPLVFMDDAPINEGVPSNFRGVISSCQTAPLVKYLEYCKGRDAFSHIRLHELGQASGFLVIGLFGNPTNWYGADGLGTPSLSSCIPDLRKLLDYHRKLQVLIDYSWEAGLGEYFFPGVDRFVADLGIAPNRVLAVVSNVGIEHRYAKYLRVLNRPASSAFRVLGLDFWLMFSGIELARKHWWTDREALVRDAEVDALSRARRPKKFLSFNRRPRWHRYLLALMLERLGLREDGLVSMSSPHYSGDWISEHSSVENYGNLMAPEAWEAIRAGWDALNGSLPWSLDIVMDNNSGRPEAYLYGTQSRELFLSSYCHIVAESYMESDEGDIFITEKTCRAVANLQPSLILGHANSLKRLRQLGFADHTVFDRNYDEAAVLGDRLTGIYHSLTKFSELSIEDLHERYHSNLEALRHNRAQLFQMPDVLADILACRLQAELWAV